MNTLVVAKPCNQKCFASDKQTCAHCTTCLICGFTGHGGLGYWACHADGDDAPVCRGKCFKIYNDAKETAKDIAEAFG